MQKKAIILFSGGLDSTTCLAIAKQQGFALYPLSFSYHQKHKYELEAAKKIAAFFGAIEHKIVSLDLRGGSSLTDFEKNVPDYQGNDEVPSTYVPARNTVFLSIALSWAEILGAHDIFFGANAIDYSGYPDCRHEYIAAFEKMANLATKAGIDGKYLKVHAPLLKMYKKEIVQQGALLGVDYGMTVSCYRVNERGEACGTCDSCYYRKKGFIEAGALDPTVYA